MPMVQFVDNQVSFELASAIIERIEIQCNLIEARENRDFHDFPELYDDDYMRMRRHSFTASVYAGFQPDTNIPGVTIEKRKYGRGHCQPELSTDSLVIQLYSYEADLNTNEIRDKCRMYNNPESEKQFVVFRFSTARGGHLTEARLVHFDANANIISSTVVYRHRARVIAMAG